MERAADLERHQPARTGRLGQFTRTLYSSLSAANDQLAGAIVVTDAHHARKGAVNAALSVEGLDFLVVLGDSVGMTEYEKEAAVVWMIFDENNKLLNSGVDLCENLETCAIILMSSSY